MYTSSRKPMTVPVLPNDPDDLDDLNNLSPLDERVSSMLAIFLLVFALLLLGADLSATVLPKFYHHQHISQAAVSPVHREIDWAKNTQP